MEAVPWILGFVGAVIGALFALIAAKYTAKAAAKVGEEANAVTFSRDLITRVESLEEDVRQLRADLDSSRKTTGVTTSLLERVIAYILAGCVGPRPAIPALIKPLLDEWLVKQYERDSSEKSHP